MYHIGITFLLYYRKDITVENLMIDESFGILNNFYVQKEL